MADQSLLEFILSLLRDPEAAQAFSNDPQGVLDQEGFGDLCGADVAEAMPLVADHAHVSFDRHYDGGGPVVHPVMPPPHPGHGEHDIHAVIRQIQYVTSNYSYTDSHNSILDNSVNQAIWADGDVLQNFDNDPVQASGEGAVAAGDDIDGTVTTGDDNVVGDDNEVSTGDGATSFGDGDAYNTGDIDVDGDGNAIAIDGDADVSDSHDDNSVDSHDDSSIHDNTVDIDNSTDDSVHDNTTDNSTDDSIHDNTVDVDNSTDNSDDSIHDNTVDVDNSTDDSIHDNTVDVDDSIHDNTVDVDNSTDDSIHDNTVDDVPLFP